MKRKTLRRHSRILRQRLSALPLFLIIAAALSQMNGVASAAGADARFEKAEPAPRPYMGWSS